MSCRQRNCQANLVVLGFKLLNNTIMKAKYRILTSKGKIKYTGTKIGSWFTLEKALQLVNREEGEMIYEYDNDGNRLWEIL